MQPPAARPGLHDSMMAPPPGYTVMKAPTPRIHSREGAYTKDTQRCRRLHKGFMKAVKPATLTACGYTMATPWLHHGYRAVKAAS